MGGPDDGESVAGDVLPGELGRFFLSFLIPLGI